MSSRSRGSRGAKAPLGAAYEPALQLAYDQIARRARSEVELRRRLQKAGSDPDVIERVIERLKELRYLDDAAFAASRTRGLAARGFGPRAVAARLYQAGVAPGLAADGIGETFGADEPRLAREALERRLRGRTFRELERRERERLLRWLAGRGFSASAIAAACEEQEEPWRD